MRTISQLIEKLQEEKRKYGDIEVLVHVDNDTFGPQHIEDIATFDRKVIISSEPAE